MVTNKSFEIEIAYASPDRQVLLKVRVEEGSTIESAIDRSGILDLFPEIDLSTQKVGIFSQIKKLNEKLQAGDRLEIYRPLLLDPKEARRLRAKKNTSPRKMKSKK